MHNAFHILNFTLQFSGPRYFLFYQLYPLLVVSLSFSSPPALFPPFPPILLCPTLSVLFNWSFIGNFLRQCLHLFFHLPGLPALSYTIPAKQPCSTSLSHLMNSQINKLLIICYFRLGLCY